CVRHAAERQPAELAVIVLEPRLGRLVVAEAQQLFAQPVLSLQTPVILRDHGRPLLHGTGMPAPAGSPSNFSQAATLAGSPAPEAAAPGSPAARFRESP